MKKIFLSLTLLLLCSCASFWGSVLEKPQVELDHIKVKDASLKGTTLVFVVSVDNPNKVDLKVDQINYKVFVNEKEITQAKTDKAVNVPAQSKANVEIPLPIEYNKIFTDLKELMFAESATYKIEGDAKLSLFTIPFTKKGEFKLR